MTKRRRAGFTLIELIVAIAIVMVLGAVAYASYVGIEAKSRDNAAIAMADQLAQNITHYAALNNGSLPSACGANYTQIIGDLGTYAELPSTVPSVFLNAWYDGRLGDIGLVATGCPATPSSSGGWAIMFSAVAGTGTWYCRDSNGLSTVPANIWSSCP